MAEADRSSSGSSDAPKVKAPAGYKDSLLIEEVRKQDPDLADKMSGLAKLEASWTKRWEGKPAPEHHLSKDEYKEQRRLALTADEIERMQKIDYGTFVAEEDGIQVSPTVFAFGPGMPVPISYVESQGLLDEDPSPVRRVEE